MVSCIFGGGDPVQAGRLAWVSCPSGPRYEVILPLFLRSRGQNVLFCLGGLPPHLAGFCSVGSPDLFIVLIPERFVGKKVGFYRP